MHRNRNEQWEARPENEPRGAGGWWYLAAFALAIGVVGGIVTGCGSNENVAVDDAGDGGATVTVPAYETSRDAVDASVAPAPVQVPASETDDATGAAPGAMPPDILVTASQTVVEPGDVIDIAVQATPDVTEMTLWDGIHDRQALTYDADAKAWRVSYRVPLHLPWARTGLAITAKNDAQRWCRSWVFIESPAAAQTAGADGSEASPVAVDSTGTQPLARDVSGPGER